MTCEQAVEALDDALAAWSDFACEQSSPDTVELKALGKARDALEVLRQEHVRPVERSAA